MNKDNIAIGERQQNQDFFIFYFLFFRFFKISKEVFLNTL